MNEHTDGRSWTDEALERVAEQYGALFAEADINLFRAHFSIVRSGVRLSQAVDGFLTSRFGLNAARYSLLRTLYFADGRRMQQIELARALNVSSPNVTQLVDGLVRDGLVGRAASESDRRVTYAQLTPDGEQLCEQAIPAMGRFMQQTTATFSSAEMDQIVDLLARFRHHLSSMNSDPQP